MTRDAPVPLFHPFDTGDLHWPAGGSVLFLGARPEIRLPAEFQQGTAMVQGFRPDFLALKRVGLSVSPEPIGERYDLALVLATRHRGENELRMADAIERVKPGRLVVMAGGKTDGISSLRKRMEAELPLDGHLSKNHGVVFWLTRGAECDAFAAKVKAEEADRPLVEGRFVTAPGMFSHDRGDAGSRLLAEHLPAGLKGAAADFCAGWGYLSVALAERCKAIESIDLFEADHASLEAAKRNVAALAAGMHATAHWTDLATEKVERRFDVVVMNPPFHQGRAADPGIGHAMIRAASNALKPGGQLFMVANRGLPYEPALKAGFARVEELADEGGFRIWKARR
jgi:16S rRNA (guanine1207-N2)-methyltransferase